MKKIQWKKMHVMDYYNGECVYCGGKCQDSESVKNWEILTRELENANPNNSARYRYLLKKRNEKLNFTWGN